MILNIQVDEGVDWSDFFVTPLGLAILWWSVRDLRL